MQEYGYNLDQKTVKALSVLTPWRTAAAIALDWAVIAAAIAFSEWMQTVWALVLAWVVIGGRMHALGVLIHEFAHYRFVSDKKVSEWVGDILLACECDARGRLGFEDARYPQGPRLRAALDAALGVATAPIATQAAARGLKGPQVGELIHQARVDAVATALTA